MVEIAVRPVVTVIDHSLKGGCPFAVSLILYLFSGKVSDDE